MAQKRMFSLHIVDSDAFLDMPVSTQLLYFHLCMRADDEGFVGNPKKIIRMIGASDDDYKLLVVKRFLLIFESLVMVVKHWLIHNTIRMDRFSPTTYEDEKKLLDVKENKAYTLAESSLATNGLPSGNQMETQVKLSKDNISKDSKEAVGELENVFLSNEELAKLKTKYGKSAANHLIEELSTYMGASGKKYRSHYATLLNWARRKGTEEVKIKAPVVVDVVTPEQAQVNKTKLEEVRKAMPFLG